VGELTRFEILPFARGEEEAAALLEQVRLTVTCSLTQGLDHSVEFATRLRALGHEVTVHLAARMVRDRMHLDQVLTALAQAGIDDTFVIGGDARSPHGPYASALELLRILHRHPHRPRTIGVAGYPEGHPSIDPGALTETLREKGGLANYITTQLCFNPKTVLAWVQAMRRAGIRLPVIVGVPGAVERRKLLEIAARVGVGPSLAYLRKQGGLKELLRLSANSVKSLHEVLSPVVGDSRFGIAGFHYFTFNRLLETCRLARVSSRCHSGDFETQNEVAPR
jgi:methylenetetrahydrofolate reductase (NADPH)